MRRAALLNVDWSKVMSDLSAGGGVDGLSERRLAALLGVSRSTLWAYTAGATPRWPVGNALLQLWAERTGKPMTSAPMTPMRAKHLVRRSVPPPRPETSEAFNDLATWARAIVTSK